MNKYGLLKGTVVFTAMSLIVVGVSLPGSAATKVKKKKAPTVLKVNPKLAPVTVNVVINLTGAGGAFGQASADALKLAVNDLNRVGGVKGHKLVLNMADDQSNTATSLVQTQRVVGSANLLLISSSSTAAQVDAPVAAQAQEVALIPTISIPSVITGNQPYSFSNGPNNTLVITPATKAWVNANNLQSVAIVGDTDVTGESTQVAQSQSAFNAIGTTVNQTINLVSTDSAINADIPSILANKPGGVVLATSSAQAGQLVNAIEAAQPNTPIFLDAVTAGTLSAIVSVAASNMKFVSLYGAVANGVSSQYNTIFNEYQSKFGQVLSAVPTWNYEAVELYADAGIQGGIQIWKNNSTVRAQLDKYFKTRTFSDFAGSVQFEQGLAARTQYLVGVNSSGVTKVIKNLGLV
jgi:ABC-type branched-subunit amino acid transport system substrate-binding protein